MTRLMIATNDYQAVMPRLPPWTWTAAPIGYRSHGGMPVSASSGASGGGDDDPGAGEVPPGFTESSDHGLMAVEGTIYGTTEEVPG